METSLAHRAEDGLHLLSRHMLADGFDIVADLSKSQGSWIHDSKRGTRFLDFFSCFATCPLGYNHPKMTTPEAIRRLGEAAVNKPSNSDLYSWQFIDFVKAFSRTAKPDFFKYCFFIEGGTLAVENCLKAAFDWKVQKNFAKGVSEEKGYKVIHFKDAFHGRSGYTLSLTNTDPAKTDFFPKFDWPRVLNPFCQFPLEGENLTSVEQREAESLRQIRQAIEKDPDDIACIILEPIQSEGGDHHFRLAYHQAIRDICDEFDILMIYDEVQTGFGATGRFWCLEHFVRPDLISFGKKSQVCGVLATERMDEVPKNVFKVSSRINSTWGGNLVDMTRCTMYLDIYEEERLLEKVEANGRKLIAKLLSLQSDFPDLVSNVRGRGLLCAFDLPNQETRSSLLTTLYEKELLILSCGTRSVRFRTALNIPWADLEEGLSRLEEALTGIRA